MLRVLGSLLKETLILALVFFVASFSFQGAHANSEEQANTVALLTRAFTTQDKDKAIKCLEGTLSILSETQSKLLLQLCIHPSKKEITFSYRENEKAVPVTGVFTQTTFTLNEKVKNLQLEIFKGSVGDSLVAFLYDLGVKNKEGIASFLDKYKLETLFRDDYHEVALLPKSNEHKLKFIKLSFNNKKNLEVIALQMRENFDQYIFFIEKITP